MEAFGSSLTGMLVKVKHTLGILVNVYCFLHKNKSPRHIKTVKFLTLAEVREHINIIC